MQDQYIELDDLDHQRNKRVEYFEKQMSITQDPNIINNNQQEHNNANRTIIQSMNVQQERQIQQSSKCKEFFTGLSKEAWILCILLLITWIFLLKIMILSIS